MILLKWCRSEYQLGSFFFCEGQSVSLIAYSLELLTARPLKINPKGMEIIFQASVFASLLVSGRVGFIFSGSHYITNPNDALSEGKSLKINDPSTKLACPLKKGTIFSFRKFHLPTMIFRFYVNLPGCITWSNNKVTHPATRPGVQQEALLAPDIPQHEVKQHLASHGYAVMDGVTQLWGWAVIEVDSMNKHCILYTHIRCVNIELYLIF